MAALVIGVCLAGGGTIVNVFAYFYDLEKKAEAEIQIIALGMVGVGATLASWSELNKASEKGWSLFIVIWFVIVLVAAYCFVRRNRRVVTPVDSNEGSKHESTNNEAIDTTLKRPGNSS
jgi:heme/copper-type cytochrome/quinol oxidase subunit 4